MISNIISKPVIEIYKGKQVGNILNVIFNESMTRLEGYVFFDEENEYFLPIKNIYKESNECVLINNETAYSFYYLEGQAPINKKVYTLDGVFVGNIKDAVIENDKIIKFITDLCEFLPKNIVSNGEDCIILGEKKINKIPRKVNFKNFMPSDNVVKILDYKESKEFKEVELPPRITASTIMLIGRIVKDQIMGFNNEIIAKKNDVISNKTIELAKKHNRINELMFNSF